MPTVTKSPADRWPQASRGLTIVLLPGVHSPAEFGGATDMTLQGGENVVIEGSLEPGGGEPPCSLRFHDGCHRLQILGPLEVRESRGRGVRITGADEIHLSDLYIHDCSIEGVITGNCPNGVYTSITVEDSRTSPDSSVAREYPPDRRHGIYVSGDASGSIVERLTVRRVTGSGLQANGAGMDEIIRSLTASELVFEHCGSGGTPPISLMAVQNSSFEQFNIDWTASDRWCVLFADGHGNAYACTGNLFQTYTVPRNTHAAEEEGSRGNTFTPGQGWEPGPAPEPGPEPEPVPPDNEALAQALDDAQAAVAAITQQTAEANAALAAATAAMGVVAQQASAATEALARAEAALSPAEAAVRARATVASAQAKRR